MYIHIHIFVNKNNFFSKYMTFAIKFIMVRKPYHYFVLLFYRSGSIIADYNVVVPETSLPDLGKANADLASHKENLDLFNQSSPVTKAVIQNNSS